MYLQTIWNLFVAFFRATLLGFGGGPSIIPLYENEAVHVFKWVTKDEFGQMVAFANALPGPIATKISMYMGYKVAGWPGALAAVTAVVLPTGVAVIFVFALLGKFKESPFFKGMMAGIRPVVFVMLATLAWDFAKYAFQPYGTGPLNWLPFGFAAAFFISTQYFNLSPIWGVAGSLVLGGLLLR